MADKGNKGGKGGSGGTASSATLLTRGAASEPVTVSQLNAEFDKLRAELKCAFSEDINTKVDTAIFSIQSTLNTKVRELEEKVESLSFQLDEISNLSKETVEKLSNRIAALESNSLYNTILQNDREQRSRKKTFRLHGRKFSSKTSRECIQEMFDYLISPCYSRAVADGVMSEIPDVGCVGEYAHPLKQKNPDVPPSVIFKFQSRSFYEIFMSYSRNYVEELNEKLAVGVKKMRVGLDLTHLNRKAMSFLLDNAAVDKVRLGAHTVQFKLKSNTEKWLSVYNPTASCIADMQVRVNNPLLSAANDDE